MTAGRNKEKSKRKKSNIFISWAGQNSKEFAKGLKKVIEELVFDNTDVKCFVSDQDIASGTDWWEKIKRELKTCKLSIVCITKENLLEPWIYFEAGAVMAQGIPCIPLLINCNIKSLSTTPLKGNQAIDFYDQSKFIKMLKDINNSLNLGLSENQISKLGNDAYINFKKESENIFSNLKDLRIFNTKYVYPTEVTNVKRNTVFVSVPMASIRPDQYPELQKVMEDIKEVLFNIGFSEVICPIAEISTQDSFDGGTKAIKSNFPKMKHADSLLIVYPWKVPSSILVEAGYGIALCKRTVIFHGEGLPYIMEDAGSSIAHVKTYTFSNYNDIIDIIKRNGMALFGGAFDG